MKSLFLTAITGLSLLLGSSGCTTAGNAVPTDAGAPTESIITPVELLTRLSNFHDRFSTSVQAAAELIKEGAAKLDINKRALIWEMIVIHSCRDAVFQRDHLAALLDTWALCVQMRAFFETGDGRGELGEHTALALEASRELEEDIERVAAAALPTASFPKARETVRAFAAAHPMHGACVREPLRLYQVTSDVGDAFSWVLDASLTPFRAIGGMDETAQAIHAAALVAEEISSTVKLFPQATRWETELLLYDIEERQTVASTVASFDRLSKSTEALSKTADRLPEEIQEKVTLVLRDVEKQQVEFRKTLVEGRATLTGVTEASAELGETAKALEVAAANWEKTLHAFRLVVQELSPDPEKAEEETEPGPSVIEILGNTAKEIATAGVELRGALAEFHRLINAEGIDETVGQLDAAVGRADVRIRGLAGHIALLCVAVIAVFFVVLLSYRFAAGHLLKHKG